MRHLFLLFLIPCTSFAGTITQLTPVTVIGSSIENNDTNRLLPVTVLTAKDIQKTGVRTVNDLLRYIPSVDFIDNGNQNGLMGSAGSSFVQLRGLSARNTLVLLDGKRMPLNPTQDDDGFAAGVDINLIPVSAIERVEILKSGGSAVYGSDAVAGVVNFITKKNSKGVNVFGNYGNSTHNDGEEKNLGMTAGFGDLTKNNHTTFLSFEYFKRDPIYRADRSLTQSVDFRHLWGSDMRSVNAPQGNIIDTDGNITGTYRPCPPEDRNGNGCRYNTAGLPLSEIIGTERYNVLINNALKFNATTELNSSFIYSRTDTPDQIHPAPGVLTMPNGDNIRSRFMQGGPRTSDRSVEFFQIKSALNGVAFGQFWTLTGGYGENNNDRYHTNYYLRKPLQALVASGQIDPTVMSNDQQLINSIKQSFNLSESSSLAYADFKLQGDLFQSESTTLSYAAGVQWRQETLSNKPDTVLLTDQLYGGFTIPKYAYSRNTLSGFSELNLDLLSNIKMQAALRYDGYKTAENISPSIAIAYTPDERISLHANWGQNFLMPTLKQMYSVGDTSAITVHGVDCHLINKPNNCVVPGSTVGASNPNLKPEHATVWDVGFAFKPAPFLKGTLDYWQIDKTGEVIMPDYITAIQNGGVYTINKGEINMPLSNVNLAKSSYKGVDASINLQSSFDGWGDLSLKNNLTYYLSANRQSNPQSQTEIMDGYYGSNTLPPWRWLSALTWATHNWTTSVIVRSTGGFMDTTAYPTQTAPMDPNTRTVRMHTEADLITSYTGINHLTLTTGIKNFTNTQPPFSSAASQFGASYQFNY